MDTKICGTCKEPKSLSEFAKNRAKKDGLGTQCRTCKKAMQDKWYRDNREHHIKRANTWRNKRRKELARLLFEYLLEHPCVGCGEDDPVVLDFDHVRGEKKDSVSRMVGDCRGWDTILTEIAKCEVRCSNCHRRKTAKEKGFTRFLLAEEMDRSPSLVRAADS
jgi:hypothetical protein